MITTTLAPDLTVYSGIRPMTAGECADRLNVLEAAVREAHAILLHEMENGRTPYLLKAENGGKGLGYFEDVISGAYAHD